MEKRTESFSIFWESGLYNKLPKLDYSETLFPTLVLERAFFSDIGKKNLLYYTAVKFNLLVVFS